MIFVDADQVVRADMGELYDMDLKGRPLAYTPFCDNNKDMDGYRFWKQVSALTPLHSKRIKCNTYLIYFCYLVIGFLEGPLTREGLPHQVYSFAFTLVCMSPYHFLVVYDYTLASARCILYTWHTLHRYAQKYFGHFLPIYN